LKSSVKVSTPAIFSLERILSFKGAVTGRSNPLGLKFVLKMITLFARSARFVAKKPTRPVLPGEYDAREDMGSTPQRKKFIERPA
jgi:hypothetical protein